MPRHFMSSQVTFLGKGHPTDEAEEEFVRGMDLCVARQIILCAESAATRPAAIVFFARVLTDVGNQLL